MRLKSRTTSDNSGENGPSREEIEVLCILHAVGPHGCPIGDLARKLGLSPTLARAVAEVVGPLVSTGLLEMYDDQISLSDVGARRLRDRLAELRIA